MISSMGTGVTSSNSSRDMVNRLCTRRGVDQLTICAPKVDQLTIFAPKVHRDSGNKAEPSSPTPSTHSQSTQSLISDEPSSPSLSDMSSDEWDFDKGEILGAGSMASVYKVTRRSDGRDFAAKYVHTTQPEQLQELRNEYELLQTLCHESVVCATQLSEGCMNACFYMELCRGGSVEDRVRRHGAFSEQVATSLAKQLLEGLDYLHSHRIVHRDIKPMNLLLVHDDTTKLKIADFNSAMQLHTQCGSSLMLSARGTQLYAAPELRFGLQWNERVDVWAAGLCIFFMLRSQQPFDSASRERTQLLQQGRLPLVAWGAMSKPMVNLVRQCLNVEMRDRPSPMELLEHRIFTDSTKSAPVATAVDACNASMTNARFRQCFAPLYLASSGLLMQWPSTPCCATQESPCQLTVRDLASRHYMRSEGRTDSSVKAWTSPI